MKHRDIGSDSMNDSNMNNSNMNADWKKYALLLMLMYLLIYIFPLGVRPPTIPDELRYAEIPREMITTGNWVSPHLNGLRYFEKPVLGYWVTGISLQLFGDNAFAMRLPSALSAGLSALVIVLMVSHFTQRRYTALKAAMIYLSMLGVYLVGTINILDSLFSFLLTAAFVTFYFSHCETDPKKRLAYLLLLGIFCGSAFLAKGFLVFVLLGAVLGPFVIWQGRWRELFSRGWIVVLTTLIVIAPWAVMIHLQEPDYWYYFFWEEHVKRFTSDYAQHSEPIWFYLLYLPLLALPWIVQLPVALKNVFSSGKHGSSVDNDLVKYTLLWFLMPFIFFSISRGKLPTYILPCLAPLAILLTIGIEHYLSEKKDEAEKIIGFKIANGVLAAFFFLVSVALVLIQTGVVGKIVWAENETWKWLLLAAAFFTGGIILLLTFKKQSGNRRTILQSLSVVAVIVVINIALPQRTIESKIPGEFLLSHKDKVTEDTILFSDDRMIHAVNWYYNRTDVYLTGAGESRHGLSFPDSSHRLIEGKALQDYIASHVGRDAMVLVHHANVDEQMRAIMPDRAQHSQWGKFVLWYIPVNDDHVAFVESQQ